MKNVFGILRNFLGLVIKLSAIPIVLYTSTGLIPTLNSEPLRFGLGTFFILFGLLGMMLSDLLILRFGNGNLHFSTRISRLVDVGLYAKTRHPFTWFFSFYQSGVFLIFMGFSWHTLLLTLSCSLICFLWLLVIQEPLLLRSLGKPYEEYKKRTPFWYWKVGIADNLQVGFRQQFVWLIGMLFLRFWYRIKVEGTENIPYGRPFLIVSNHESYLDPFLFAIFIPYETKFVTTADIFTTPLMRFLLKGTGSFPMHRHKQDLKSIRTMIRMINTGQVVCIFPEGGRSIDGSPLPILKETLKLIQHCKVPILPVHLDGAYEIWPRWAQNRRRGKVRVSFKPIIPLESQSDLKNLETQVKADIFAEKKIFRSVKSRAITGGMEHLLWACYKCHARNSIEVTSGQSLRCSDCDTVWQVAEDYSLSTSSDPQSLSSIQWIEKIERDILEYPLHLGLPFTLETDEIVHLHSPIVDYTNEGAVLEEKELSLSLSNQRIVLSNQLSQIETWSLTNITIFTMDYFNAVSIGVGGVRHTFKLPPQEVTLKWQTYFDTLKAEFSKK
ncbi:MAG: 1-acyl-sn-glycerol-3-phosphate acyltransferase [Candidatus Marinimicrobia bacterium]|nr:1-acyl-sn-glycerol-3-phosphate acyltransferase [Candidatus Neomarinimicrobiota bacterium]